MYTKNAERGKRWDTHILNKDKLKETEDRERNAKSIP